MHKNLLKELTEFLFILDPLSIGTVDNDLFNEYEKEAKEIIEKIINNSTEPSQYSIIVKQIFDESFYENCLSDDDCTLITAFIVQKILENIN